MATIWHPFTQMKTAPAPLQIVKGKGIYLYTNDGTPYLDGIASWWVNLHGHCHPYIAEKIGKQALELEHVLFAGFTHPWALELTDSLLSLMPGNMKKLFFSDNGSTAVEVALKIALQYWHNLGIKKKKVLSFEGAYHGDTFGCMAAAGKNAFNRPFWDHLFDVITLPPPLHGEEEKSIQAMKQALASGDVACFLYEPLIQGVGGMRIHSSIGLNCLLSLCHAEGVLTIADEVMTGFGRTGTLFASDQLEETPDMICVSKGLTGGFLPLGATACKEKIYRAFHSDEKEKAFLHGHSYTANPLACVSALASLELLVTSKCYAQKQLIEAMHQKFVYQWKTHPTLTRCETLGTILVLEYRVSSPTYFSSLGDALYRYFIDQKVILRPLGNVVYVLPPYCITMEELESIYEIIEHTLEEMK